MKIFISWSGEQSRRVATTLRDWLPYVLQGSEPWLSSEDIRKGARWQPEMTEALQNPAAGILCVTHANLTAPWLLFEAGAISKAVTGTSLVCTYLIDVDNANVGLTLGMFQSTAATREDTLKLLENLNAIAPKSMPTDRLANLFQKFWPELERAIAEARQLSTSSKVQRDSHELLEEILDTVRGLSRSMADHQPESDAQRLMQALMMNPELLNRLNNLQQHAILQEELRKRGKKPDDEQT
jgi:hypothetical protein